jgi:iron complex transport system ATP-binding protein
MSSVLTVKNLSFSYIGTEKKALNACSLTLERGQIMALLGANGAGKSTLLSAAMGWIRPGEGVICLNEAPLGDYSSRRLGQVVSLVPQEEPLPFNFTLLDYVLLGRTPHLRPLELPGTADENRAREALERVGMAALGARGIKTLSGGEKQLVTLARSLCQDPEILLLDEPTSSLDLKHKGEIIDLLKVLAAEGMSILFTSHDPQFTAALATHISLMKEGSIIDAGPARDMLEEDKLSRVYGRKVRVRWIDGTPLVLY